MSLPCCVPLAASQFGAVLDMVTDRACTNVLLLELSRLYGDYRWLSFFWTACASLDLVSHWWHMHQSLSQGASSHKALGKERSWLLRIYYSRVWLFLICAANEACLLLAYAAARPETAGLDVRVARSALPEQVLRARSLGWLPWLRSGVEEEGPLLISLTACLALVTAPVFLLKQLISAVQLAEAAALTAEQDARDRKAKREAMERAKL